jgi:hypothetical protein
VSKRVNFDPTSYLPFHFKKINVVSTSCLPFRFQEFKQPTKVPDLIVVVLRLLPLPVLEKVLKCQMVAQANAIKLLPYFIIIIIIIIFSRQNFNKYLKTHRGI